MPKRKAVQKAITSYTKNDNGDATNANPKRTKTAAVESKEEGKKPFNKTATDYGTMTLDCGKKSETGKDWNFKISSWNVVSLKALTNKNGMEFLEKESPDVMCFQETKCSEKKCPDGAKPEGYHRYFVAGVQEGYAGVAMYCKQKPISVSYGIGNKTHDSEGRVITAEFDKFYLVAAYVPNAGQKLKTLDKRLAWDPLFKEHLKKLDKKKPVVLCGDLNVAHNRIDLKNPDTNTKSAGFTQEERDGFTALLEEGFVDTFRHMYPQQEGAYTFWNYIGNARSRNTGWRIDYFVVSKRFLPSVCDNVIRNQVFGSDHCPITLFLSL